MQLFLLIQYYLLRLQLFFFLQCKSASPIFLLLFAFAFRWISCWLIFFFNFVTSVLLRCMCSILHLCFFNPCNACAILRCSFSSFIKFNYIVSYWLWSLFISRLMKPWWMIHYICCKDRNFTLKSNPGYFCSAKLFGIFKLSYPLILAFAVN